MSDTSEPLNSADREQADLNVSAPTLYFFRATPPDLANHPPLASSFQSLETCFFLIALDRFPSALVSCASAWESAGKARLKVPEGDDLPLARIIQHFQALSPSLNTYDRAKLRRFREARNHIVHYGFSPKDDQLCASLLLETGLPFLARCYRELFDFYLDWREIRPSSTNFHDLTPAERDKAGLLPDVAQQLRFATEVYRRAKDLRGPNFSYCFRPFAHFVRLAFKRDAMTAAEAKALEWGDSDGLSFEEQRKEKEELERTFKHVTWEFNCPVCAEHGSVVAELDEAALDAGRLALRRCACVACHFVVPSRAPFLSDVVLADQLQENGSAILKSFGLQ